MQTETVNTNLIDKDELAEVAVTINSLRYLCGDVVDEFFHKFNPAKSNEDLLYIGHCFSKYSAYMDLIDDSIRKVESQLTECGITI
ncbi:MAG: hypothetical protein NC177_18375 [Ruminococcus flavefaciens]|nr:hypothetical protein [Ruminococcus flavefaciens]